MFEEHEEQVVLRTGQIDAGPLRIVERPASQVEPPSGKGKALRLRDGEG